MNGVRPSRETIGERSRTHGMTGTRFNHCYKGLSQRCTNKNLPCYKRYGGRGIKNLWNSFEEFRDDMYESYIKHVEEFGEKETTLDRIDVNGDYCKENCRWTTYKEQANNTRQNRKITFNGKTQNTAQWADEIGIPPQMIWDRLRKGWPLENVLSTEKFINRFGGKTKTI